MLGVILNRAESEADEVALYYQQRYQREMSEVDKEVTIEAHPSQPLEMIYIDEDMVS